ncbi:ABC transporter permease [Aureivirga sp. CE67]|uniref:ABC transporter permease n=1 Tax=Aureivirga sp. CE67 TaxID=1788983 RepID=UPI0018CAEB18|nr:ABC transporter permease [Aureivirga sp. CE67]
MKSHLLGAFSLGWIAILFLVAIFAYFIAPDDSSNANSMHLEIHSKRPGFSVEILKFPELKKEETGFFETLLYGKKTTATELAISSYRIKNDSVFVKEYAENPEVLKEKAYPISEWNGDVEKYISKKTFLLGTDKYGRDLLSRMIIGARISFFIGFIAVFISLVIGIPIGALSGYYGKKVDAFFMWIINVTWSIPTLLLVIAITLALGKGYWQVFIAVGLTMWVEVARVVRGQVMSVKEMQYVQAAKVLGYSDFRIILKHILPNIVGPIIVISAANFAAAILVESGLSFLGIGAQPPTPSWGGMIKDNYNYIILGKPYLAIVPGLAIMSLVMAFMMIGNSLRDILDVK